MQRKSGTLVTQYSHDKKEIYNGRVGSTDAEVEMALVEQV